MQAQTLQERRTEAPWLGLLLVAIISAALLIGGQLVTRDRGAATTTIPVTADNGAAVQLSQMSEGGIHRIGGSARPETWSFHRPRAEFSGSKVNLAEGVLHGIGKDVTTSGGYEYRYFVPGR